MQQHRTVRCMSAVLLGGTVFLGACQDNPLDVPNLNTPDVDRSYATPGNVETLGSSVFKNMFNGQYGAIESIWVQTMTMSLESHSQLGNGGMGTRAAIPRSPIANTIGNSTAVGNFRDFDAFGRNGRTAANVAAAVDRYRSETPPRTAGTAQQDYRNKAFAFFNMGYAMGHMSLLYDSAAIVIPATPSDQIPPFSGAKEVNTAALAMMDSAVLYANLATGQALPDAWVSDNAGTAMPMPRFVQVIRSFKARLRAGVARTPTERAAVDWAAVISDATAGIQSDFIVRANATTGWSTATINQYRVEASWSQQTPFILGMGDTSHAGDPSGSYRDWIATPLTQRTPFLMRTPDIRFPAGETRPLQNASSGALSATPKAGPPVGSPKLFFRNRPSGDDRAAEPWGTWYYDNHRFWGIAQASNNGPFVVLSRAENDLLAAEGHLRTNNFGAATLLIDRYRVAANLPPVTGIADLTTPVLGGTACVPNVPVGPGYTTTACGNVFEAMKWEKRVETSYTGYAQWFTDSRGWGDMVENTALEWPVPYDELFARTILSTYTTSLRAAKGTYGF